MFFERINSFRRSLAFRLALVYAVTCAILSIAAFLIFYRLMISNIHARTDNALTEELNECSSLLASKGVATLKEEIYRKAQSAGTGKVFLRLLTTDGKVIVSSDLGLWGGIDISKVALQRLAQDRPVFETFKLPGGEHNARVIYGMAGTGMVLQIGRSLRDDEEILEDFRQAFGTAIAVVLTLVALGGWVMARRSLSGVQEVTRTAMAISGGAMEKRVPLTGRGDEIDRLSQTFNHMLERIQSLITEMREVTDNIAHDLKSPVTRIRGLAEVTLTTGRSLDEYRSMAASTVEECDAMLGMINTMLEISEFEAGVATLNISNVDISTIVEEARDLFQPLAEDKGLVIKAKAPPQCLLSGDKRKLQRTLTNLLDNAIKFTPAGGTIAVSVDEGEKEVIISVHDTGRGIAADDIPHIFDRFYRADKSRSEPGAGLGLSLVMTIVKAHGGNIQVNSPPGAGSTFTVVLPRKSLRED
jgi:heavy metal sensor kinase